MEPGQAEEIDAMHICDPALVHWHSARGLCLVCKDWEVNPIEVIPEPICPNDSGDVRRGKIEGEDGIGDFLRVAIEGLGFKVQTEKVTVEVTVIDHAERPSEN